MTHSSDPLATARQLADEGKLIAALELARQAGDGHRARFLVGELLNITEQWADALDVWDELLRGAPDPFAGMQRAISLAGLGRFTEAEEAADAAFRADGTERMTRVYLNVLRRVARPERVREALAALRTLGGMRLAGDFLEGAWTLEPSPQTLSWAEVLVEAWPEGHENQALLAEVASTLGERSTADKAVLEALTGVPVLEKTAARLKRVGTALVGHLASEMGNLLRQGGKAGLTESHYELAIDVFEALGPAAQSEAGVAWFHLGHARRALAKPHEAAVAYERAAEGMGAAGMPVDAAIAQAFRAENLLVLGEDAAACALLEGSLPIIDGDPGARENQLHARLHLADARRRLGRRDNNAAFLGLVRTGATDPDLRLGARVQGALLDADAGDLLGAATQIEEAIAGERNATPEVQGRAWTCAASLRRAAGDVDGAWRCAGAVVQRLSQGPWMHRWPHALALLEFAQVLRVRGEHEAAEQNGRHALEMLRSILPPTAPLLRSLLLEHAPWRGEA